MQIATGEVFANWHVKFTANNCVSFPLLLPLTKRKRVYILAVLSKNFLDMLAKWGNNSHVNN